MNTIYCLIRESRTITSPVFVPFTNSPSRQSKALTRHYGKPSYMRTQDLLTMSSIITYPSLVPATKSLGDLLLKQIEVIESL